MAQRHTGDLQDVCVCVCVHFYGFVVTHSYIQMIVQGFNACLLVLTQSVFEWLFLCNVTLKPMFTCTVFYFYVVSAKCSLFMFYKWIFL